MEWRPIKTVPRNGQFVLAIVKGEWIPGIPFVPDTVRWGKCPVHGAEGLLRSSDEFGTEVKSDAEFTHWMPLPEPPK